MVDTPNDWTWLFVRKSSPSWYISLGERRSQHGPLTDFTGCKALCLKFKVSSMYLVHLIAGRPLLAMGGAGVS